MKKLQPLILVIIIASSLFYFYRNDQEFTGNQNAPTDLTFKIIDGRQLSLEQYRGKPVLIDFWATSCAYCIQEMPDLVALYEELSTEGLEIIGVAMSYDRPDMVLKAAKDLKIPFPIALDIDGEVADAFGDVNVTPTHFLIAPDGKIVNRIDGTMNLAGIRNKIKTMLSKEI